MKTRFTSLDVCCAAWDLRRKIVGLRVINVYDNGTRHKSYLLRLSGPGTPTDASKVLVVVDCGSSVYTTTESREHGPSLSVFAKKLRQHLQNRIVTQVSQLHFDRVLHIVFGHDPAHATHLFCEFYAAGNVVLAAGPDLEVRAVLRTLRPDAAATGLLPVAVGLPYPVANAERQQLRPAGAPEAFLARAAAAAAQNPSMTTVAWLLNDTPLGRDALEAALRAAGISPRAPLSAVSLATLQPLAATLDAIVAWIASGPATCGGMVVARANAIVGAYPEVPGLVIEPSGAELVSTRLPDFDTAVDRYLTSVACDHTAAVTAARAAEREARLAVVTGAYDARYDALVAGRTKHLAAARLIETSLAEIEALLAPVIQMLQHGVDWAIVRARTMAAAPVGGFRVEDLVWSRGEPRREPRGDLQIVCDAAPDKVLTLDPRLNARANVERHYSLARELAAKAARAEASRERAMQSARAKIWTERPVAAAAAASAVRARGPPWYQRFHWFVSSDGHLVIAGRDATQNEAIFRRYLDRARDLFVHADARGAPAVVIRGGGARAFADVRECGGPEPPDATHPLLPFAAIHQAAAAAVCFSAAWRDETPAAAFWVWPDQVTKTAPTGLYLTTGAFAIYGRKNALPIMPLVLAYGVGFRDARRGGEGGPESADAAPRLLPTIPAEADADAWDPVAVCGPMEALQAIKYRVKLLPDPRGRHKKSQNVNLAQALFLARADATPAERAGIRALAHQDLLFAMPSDTRVQAPGLSQLIKQQRARKQRDKAKQHQACA